MLTTLLSALALALRVLELLVFGRVIASWFGADPSKGILKLVHTATEPLFKLVRPLARKIPGSLDWTPALVLVGLMVVRRLLL